MAITKLISSFIVDQLSFVVARRGYATATQGIVSGSAKGSGVAMMMKKKASEESKKSTPWVPDPVTGYYRPEGQTNEIDAAELREMLLKQKNCRN
ncbi:protein SENESCENCE-ASSOCIATED GENE 21, mitochondrial-like [Bidens hawaiensis]|uniref:protein SENESCENCE-ASSOCIATED GENE 21, mitochondrial-like n=1 Tax=Bidens hawaiensis TaxID=980011 RepID=UPI00404B6775